MSGRDLTVAEAAERLGLSERTIRRQIKSGKIKAELVPGRYGDEYRVELGESAPPGRGIDKGVSDVADRSPDSPSTGAMDKPLDSPLTSALDNAMDKALDMVKSLQQEKAELYAQVAYWQAQCRHMEEQVKLLMEAKRPRWRRWLSRR